MTVSPKDLELLIRDKYAGNRDADITDDVVRLESGEPLAYVIGWVPFLGLSVRLDSRPLIPRPETEWWTEMLCEHLHEKFGDEPFSFLDLCAGSGAIGLAVLSRFPHARVSFAELSPLHSALIHMNIDENNLDSSRADIRSGDLFAPFAQSQFDIVATNPPYVPTTRELEESVTSFEPSEALFAGRDGLDIIKRIVSEVPAHMHTNGEVWIECDIANVEETAELLRAHGARDAQMRTDLYGRPRVAVGYFS